MSRITAAVAGSVIDIDETGDPVLGSIIMSTEATSSVGLGPGKLSPREILENRLTMRIEIASSLKHPASPFVSDSFHRIMCHLASGEHSPEFHLTHLDLRMPNVFVIPGPDELPIVSGLLDWEFHTFLPPLLAASFPTWLRYDGFYDLHFNPIGSTLSWYWGERRDVAQELRNVFLDMRAFSSSPWPSETDPFCLTLNTGYNETG